MEILRNRQDHINCYNLLISTVAPQNFIRFLHQKAEVLKLLVIMYFLWFSMSLFHSGQWILASGVFTICSLYVYYMFAICSLYVHYMFTICSQYVHYMFTMCAFFKWFFHEFISYWPINFCHYCLAYKQYGFRTGILVQWLAELVMWPVQSGAVLTGLTVRKSVLLALVLLSSKWINNSFRILFTVVWEE